MFGISAGEFVIILIVGLIVFGPSKLPEVGRAIGKGLRELRKAQAALSQTLNEVEEPLKSSPPVKPLTTESFVGDKTATSTTTATVEKKSADAQPAIAEKNSADAQSATVEKTSADAQPATAEKNSPPNVTTDDLIKFTKESPLVKENHNEKISDGNPVDPADNAARSSLAGSRGSSDGVDKKS